MRSLKTESLTTEKRWMNSAASLFAHSRKILCQPIQQRKNLINSFLWESGYQLWDSLKIQRSLNSQANQHSEFCNLSKSHLETEWQHCFAQCLQSLSKNSNKRPHCQQTNWKCWVLKCTSIWRQSNQMIQSWELGRNLKRDSAFKLLMLWVLTHSKLASNW